MGCNAVAGLHKDAELFEIYWHANVNAFWERASLTLSSNLRASIHGEMVTG
jgi:hypothetical protein